MGSRAAILGGVLGWLIVSSPAPLRADGGVLSLLVKGNLTTSSQIFYDPNSSDPVERAQAYSLTDSWGTGVEVKYQFAETNIAVGLSADYIRATTSHDIFTSGNLTIPVDDGYTVVPVELTGYFLIPISGPAFGIFMGGGGGAYFGRRAYTLGGVSADLVNTTPGVGIHVLGGVSYRFTNLFSLVAEMKFRDLQFQTTNAFNVSSINYLGTVVLVNKRPFDAAIHTDGIIFQLGASFSF